MSVLHQTHLQTLQSDFEDRKLKEKDNQEQKGKLEDIANNKKIYTNCGVLPSQSTQLYYFLTADETIQIGDTVIVPVGETSNELKGTVVSIGEYTRIAIPYTLEKAKKIISGLNLFWQITMSEF